LNFLL
jgi:hypothetical protein